MEREGGQEMNCSDAVEDLVDLGLRGNVQGVISRLENLGSDLLRSDDLRLASALGDLADLDSSRGLYLEADELRTRALLIKNRAGHSNPPPCTVPATTSRDLEFLNNKLSEEEETRVASALVYDEDDWEAIADRALPDVGVSERLQENLVEFKTPKRRGRGSFLYTKNGLYCDQADAAFDDDSSAKEEHSGESTGIKNLRYGTGHVLVLHDFPSSTRTTDLEKLFVESRDGTVAFRWVNDTCALAVFRTPSAALEARNSVHHPFRVRVLDEDDSLLTQVTDKDLEPPLTRPKTSARTAQRLIAHGMGLKPSAIFGSSELKKEEEARTNRIQTRQNLRDDAWGF